MGGLSISRAAHCAAHTLVAVQYLLPNLALWHVIAAWSFPSVFDVLAWAKHPGTCPAKRYSVRRTRALASAERNARSVEMRGCDPCPQLEFRCNAVWPPVQLDRVIVDALLRPL